MPQAVYILWATLLVIAVLAIPVLVFLLHQSWRAAWNIQRYFREMADAGEGIADHTDHIKALDDTISVAGGMLDTAVEVDKDAHTIEKVLSKRAAKFN